MADNDDRKPYIWEMVREAIDTLNKKCKHYEIKDYIRNKYGDINISTINCQIIVCTVNHPSRIHYPENKKPRKSETRYDFLYTTGHGEVVKYNPEEHGHWEIKFNEYGKLEVSQTIDNEEIIENIIDDIYDTNYNFPLESHLRDFIVKNIHNLKFNNNSIKLFIDENGRDGIEYPTGVGPIDILAIDENDNYFVFELKLSKGPDRALGQILRYMGWVKEKLCKKNVYGIIVAEKVDEKLKYAATMTSNIYLYEYKINFDINETKLNK